MSLEIELSHSGAAAFLQDINVCLNVEEPNPSRMLFERFQPHFASYRYMELSEALENAYRRLESGEVKEQIRRDALESLNRCAEQPLGMARSLVVIDLVHALWPVHLEGDVWRRLLSRYNGQPEEPAWIGDLVLRWAHWNFHVHLSPVECKRILNSIEPARFECALNYLATETAEPGTAIAGETLKGMCQLARRRLVRDAKSFWDEEVDPDELMARLDELFVGIPDVAVARADPEQTDRERVAANLEARWGSVTEPIGFSEHRDRADAVQLQEGV